MTHPLRDPGRRIVIAHRGDRAHLPENTMESLRRAESLGADALELDVRVSREGIPVVMHDADVARTTNASGLVRSFTLDELRGLDARGPRSGVGPAPFRIPTLEEVLETLPLPLVIEVKELPAVEPTLALVRRFGAQGRTLLGSADNVVTAALYRSGMTTCASMRDAIRLIPLALAGLTPRAVPYDVLSITRHFRGVPIPVIRMARAAARIGVATQVWTVNDPGVAEELWRGGVTGIVTDDPAAMLRVRPG